MATKLDTYACHGLDFSLNGTQGKTTCPFCDDTSQHFFAAKKTGLWDCKRCNSSGNASTFLSKLHETCLSQTEDYTPLAEHRKLAPLSLPDAGVAFNHLSGDWIFPVKNKKGTVVDLRRYDITRRNPKPLSTTGCTTSILFLDEIKEKGPILICEGDWDAIALRWVAKKLRKEVSVVGVPGANSFKPEWSSFFSRREVWLLYDNDDPGKEGMDKAEYLLAEEHCDLRRISWTSDLPEKYDIRDLLTDKRPSESWSELTGLLQESTQETYRPKLERTEFSQVVEDFKDNIHWNGYLEDALALTMASMISVHMSSDPVWLFLVGPPGVGKSLILKALSDPNEKNSIFRSTLTTETLVSGTTLNDDPSIIPALDKSTLVIKDYTAVLGLPQATQDYLMGILRDLYDGIFVRSYGNGVKRTYNSHFGMVAGVTDMIHAVKRTELGERFVKFEMIPPDYDPEDHIRASISPSEGVTPEKEDLLLDSCQAFLGHVRSRMDGADQDPFPEITEEVETRIVGLAQLISFLRVNVSRKADDLLYRPRAEVATRAAKQLKKIARSLTYIYGLDAVDRKVYSMIRQVAADTCVGWTLEVASVLRFAKTGFSVKYIENKLQISKSTVDRALADMQMLGIVRKLEEPLRNGRKGRPRELWCLSPRIVRYWEMARFDHAQRIQRYAPPRSERKKKEVSGESQP